MHAHLLFKDSASTWYTTYEEKFVTWEVLESYLRLRYDNPNRDQMIIDEMRDRKQRTHEKFSEFLTEMEALAQRMIRKMSEQEKFELIVRNMKISYKKRLALETIYSIDHLSQLCYRLDALETPLYPSQGQSRRMVNQIELDDEDVLTDLTGEETEEIFALKARYAALKYGKGKADGDTKRENPETCWNCLQIGHMWRDCEKRKRIFCHICGYMDTTAFRCPNRHNLRPAEEEDDQKNE